MRYSPEAHRLGVQEGKGIFSSIGRWLRDNRVLSTAAGIGSSILGAIPHPGAQAASMAIGMAGRAAGQGGWGPSRRCKNITPSQVAACQAGYGRVLRSGGIGLALARKFVNKNIKNITPAQVNALRNYFGRVMKGGGISLGGGGPSGYYAVRGQAGKGWKMDLFKDVAPTLISAGASAYGKKGKKFKKKKGKSRYINI